MRIGFNALGLDPSHKGGAESVFLNLVKGFELLGVSSDITYFCYPDIVETIKSFSPSSEIVVVACGNKTHLSRMDMLLTQTKVFHKLYKKYKLDVVLFANPDVGLFKYSIPTAVIPHDIQFVSRPEINKNKLQYYRNYYSYKIPFKAVDRIVCISDIDKQEIERCYPFTKSKTVKIYDPIDVSKTDVTINESKEDFILAVNIQYPHKNIVTLLRAFSLVAESRPDIRLKMAGAKNEYTNTLEELAKELKIDDKVDFLGFISKDYLDSLWSTARLYINPSLYEGFGMTSVESVLHGAPTLLSDLDVNREVTNDLCNYYSDLENPQSLAEEILKLLAVPFDKQKSVEMAYELVDRYCLKTISSEYLRMLHGLVGGDDAGKA